MKELHLHFHNTARKRILRSLRDQVENAKLAGPGAASNARIAHAIGKRFSVKANRRIRRTYSLGEARKHLLADRGILEAFAHDLCGRRELSERSPALCNSRVSKRSTVAPRAVVSETQLRQQRIDDGSDRLRRLIKLLLWLRSSASRALRGGSRGILREASAFQSRFLEVATIAHSQEIHW